MFKSKAKEFSNQCYREFSTEFSDRRRKSAINTLHNRNFR